MKNILLVLLFVFTSGMVLASEKSFYDFSWLDKDKEIYVLQNRKFRKNGNLYIGFDAVKTLSGAFIDSYGASARAGYFFSEDWGVEFAYGKNSGKENDTAGGVKEQGTVPYYRKIDSYMGGMVMWSPFYSKINTFNKVFYFDWMFGLGLASINTLDNRNQFNPGADKETLVSENAIGALWNTGFRFYLTDHWSLRLDITGLNFQAKKTREIQGATNQIETNQLFSNFDLGLGLNYTF